MPPKEVEYLRICRSLKRIGPILLGIFGILCIFALCLQFGWMIGQTIVKSMEDQNEEVKAIPFEAQFSKLLPRRRMLGRTRRSDEED